MLASRIYREWLWVLCVASLLVGFVTWSKLARPFDNVLLDTATGLAAPPPDDRILIVEIDDATLQALGRWPLNRAVHARMIDRLTDAGAAQIDYDVLFLEPTAEDDRLAAALRRSGHVWLPAFAPDADSATGRGPTALPVAAVEQAAAGVAQADVPLDEDGLVRRALPTTGVGPSPAPQAPLAIARALDRGVGGKIGGAPFLISFVGKGRFRHIPFAAVLAGEVPPAFIKDKLVLVGVTATGAGDIFAVPRRAGSQMSGVELQANIINTLLSGKLAHAAPRGWALVASLLPTWLAMGLFLRLRPGANLRLTMGLSALVLAGCMALVPLGHVWIAPGPAMAGLVSAYSLWSWRRLSAISGFIVAQAADLSRDAKLPMPPAARRFGDPLQEETRQLQAIITQLRQLRSFAADVIERLPDATCVVSESGTIRIANAAAVALYGGAVEGKKFDDFLHRIHPGIFPDDTEIRRQDGTTLYISRAPLGTSDRIVRLADVTEMQRAANEREEFVQFLSHDMRAPNAAIISLLENFACSGNGDGAANAPLDEMIGRIRRHAAHALGIADDFVQLSRARRRTFAFAPVDLADIIREAADMVWPSSFIRHIKIREMTPASEALVMGERSMLLRAAINLLDNAVKFAPEGATIQYAVETRDGQTIFSVSGPGPQMPEARKGNAFLSFASGRDTRGAASAGLGLAFVQVVAHRHGGAVEYRHIEGFGACFEMSLPQVHPEA